jgi:hypothetical protein
MRFGARTAGVALAAVGTLVTFSVTGSHPAPAARPSRVVTVQAPPAHTMTVRPTTTHRPSPRPVAHPTTTHRPTVRPVVTHRPSPRPVATHRPTAARRPAVYRTISGYRYCGRNSVWAQPCIDAGHIVLYYPAGQPVLAGHDYLGWAWLGSVPTGARVRVASGSYAGTYVVYRHAYVGRHGGTSPSFGSSDLTLQSCAGSGMSFSLMHRV